eukprot:Stramenopile-MAST_4_protein_6432
MEVVGFVAPGYEPVKALFRQHFIDGLEDRAQLCVYVRGEKVIDIWGSAVGKPYGPGFLQNVFSTTKVLTSLVVAMLVDRGQLSYDTPIDEIWPEYGQHKKQGTTVAQLMRHEAGLPKFDQPIAAEALKTENIRKGSISDLIASQSLSHFPLKRREYHAQTRGWIANEIVRRVDVPRHRTIGQFLREEVSEKLDIAEELFIGQGHLEHVHRVSNSYSLFAVPLHDTPSIAHPTCETSMAERSGRLKIVPSRIAKI